MHSYLSAGYLPVTTGFGGSLPDIPSDCFCLNVTNKLGCRRDSARRRLLCRSRSFKVTDFGTNRKPVCDFILVTYSISRTVFKFLRSIICQIITFDKGMPLVNVLILDNLFEYCYKLYSVKT